MVGPKCRFSANATLGRRQDTPECQRASAFCGMPVLDQALRRQVTTASLCWSPELSCEVIRLPRGCGHAAVDTSLALAKSRKRQGSGPPTLDSYISP
jgi:hypothetical protein